jgi:hypothetical protein
MVVLLIVVQPWMMPPAGHDAPSYSLLSLKSLLEICVLGKNRPKRFLPASPAFPANAVNPDSDDLLLPRIPRRFDLSEFNASRFPDIHVFAQNRGLGAWLSGPFSLHLYSNADD